MADEPTKDLIGQALGIGGGGIALTALGALLRGLFTGSAGQEKELRMEYREEIKTLREELRNLRTEMDQQEQRHQIELRAVRTEMQGMTTTNMRLLTTRAEARADLNALQRAHGLTVTVWPDDPPTTSGGTP